MKKWIAFLLIVAMMNSLVCYAEEPEVEELEVIIGGDIQRPEAELDIIPQDDSLLLDNEETLDLLPETDIDLDELLSDAEYSSDGSTYDDEAVSNEINVDNTNIGPYDQRIKDNYKRCIKLLKENDGRDSFSGWCGQYVRYQLQVNDIWYKTNPDNFNGNQVYYSMVADAETQTGYIQKKYEGKNCLYDIIQERGNIVENIVVSWYKESKGTPENPGVGHTNFIYGIIDGIVYFSESYTFDGWNVEEGEPLKLSIDDFMNRYNQTHVYAIGAVLFVPKVIIQKVILDYERVELNINDSIGCTLHPTIEPKEATVQKLSWASSDPSVANVDDNGHVQPVSAGEAIITCSTNDGSGVSATCKVKVTKLDLNADKLDMYIGQTYTLKGTIDGKSVSCSFKSSNSKVVSVDKKGRITAKNVKKATKVTITATAPKKQGTETCDVVVHPKPKKISIKQVNSKTLNIGDTLDLSVKFDAPDALAKIYWSSSNEKVATVNAKGHVVAVGAGSVTISAKTKKIGGLTAKRLTAKIELTVNGPKKPTGIRISAPGTEVKIGEKLQLTAELIPENAEGSIKWESMNKKVAKVTQKGVVNPVKVGKVKIKATATKNANAWVTIEITVKESDAPTSISIGASKKSLYVSEKWWLNYKLNPADARTTLTFTSSDETVATVDGNGLITAIGAGTSTITVKTHNNKKASCRITVLPLPTIQLDRNSVSLKVGETYSLTCFVTGKVKEPAQFSSSDETVATVDNSGVITAINQGEAVITASLYDGISASCQVTVESATSDTFSGDLSIFLGKNLGEIRSVLGDSFSKEVMDYSKYMAYEGNNGIRVCVRKDDLMIVSLKIVASTPAEYNFYGVNARNSFQEVREVLCNQKGWDIVMYPGDPYNPQEEAYNCETKTEAWRTIGIYSKYYEHSMYLEIGYMDVAMCADRY